MNVDQSVIRVNLKNRRRSRPTAFPRPRALDYTAATGLGHATLCVSPP